MVAAWSCDPSLLADRCSLSLPSCIHRQANHSQLISNLPDGDVQSVMANHLLRTVTNQLLSRYNAIEQAWIITTADYIYEGRSELCLLTMVSEIKNYTNTKLNQAHNLVAQSYVKILLDARSDSRYQCHKNSGTSGAIYLVYWKTSFFHQATTCEIW